MQNFVQHLKMHPELVVNNDFIRGCIVNYPEMEDGVEGIRLAKPTLTGLGNARLSVNPKKIIPNKAHRPEGPTMMLLPTVPLLENMNLPELLQETQAWQSKNEARQASLEAQIEISTRETDRLKGELEGTQRRQDDLASLTMLVHPGKEGHDVGVAIKNLVSRLISS